MGKALVVSAAALAVAGCVSLGGGRPCARAVSPDGRNEIRLYADPLSYEVLRDGMPLTARTEIDLEIGGRSLAAGARAPKVTRSEVSGERLATPVYKKDFISLDRREACADFGDWAVRLAARDDGVAYRFELGMPGRVRVTGEKAPLGLLSPDQRCSVCQTREFGSEETVPETLPVSALGAKGAMQYLPLVYCTNGAAVAVTESDVRDYPAWYLCAGEPGDARLDAEFARFPKRTVHGTGWGHDKELPDGGRWIWVRESEEYLVETDGGRTLPWRLFVLADEPAKLCESDAVYALASPRAEGSDFSWVKPGKVAWDWWNDWNLEGPHIDFKAGCNTRTYEYFIDFAARTGVEYVIFDEGWSEELNIWKFHPDVDVPHLIAYARERGVGIVLWMAWAQIYGHEAKVAEHFAKLGAKGFKVDFMDRADADVSRFLERFASECARHRMLIDYHGMTRPVGMQRMYPNIVNFEGVHGLETMKFYHGEDMMANDVRAFFLRLTAGPMDYTPGAMLNYPVGAYAGDGHNPGSIGTRCRQIAMMSMYEAPLQMLCDSPTRYEANMECFRYMAAVPVVWDEVRGLGGCPDSFAAVARRSGSTWYAAAITDSKARDFSLDTAFLGGGVWKAEIFRDADDSDRVPTRYVREERQVQAGATLDFHMAPGGGFSVKFTR